MLLIGLTGGIGSGKSTVAALFAAKGIKIIDTDQLARDVIQPNSNALKQIVEKFGPEILLKNGNLDRLAVRKKVFANSDDRVWLEKLLHPLIRAEIKNQIEHATSPYCIVVIPLLLETEPNPLINRILIVDALEAQQIQRAKKRDNLTTDDILAVMKTQVSRKQRLEKANDIIYNDGEIAGLATQVEKLHQFYFALSR